MSDKIPVRIEMQELPGPDPSAVKIGFSVKEYNGCPIETVPPGMTHEELL